jgi:hypothetical protein
VRAALAGLLIAVLGLATVSVVVSAWADDALYDTEIMVQAFGDLPRDPERAEVLGEFIAAEAVAGLAVEERIAEVLPLGLSLFAGPVTDGVEEAVSAASTALLQTDMFAEMWEEALPVAHEAFVEALQGTDDGVLTAEAGVVAVDVSAGILATYEQVADILPEIPDDGLFARVTGLRSGHIKGAIGDLLVTYVPDDLGSFVLIESPALAAVQEADDQLGRIVWLSLFAFVTATAAAVVMAPRKWTLIALGATAGVAVLIGLVATTGAERAIISAMADLPFTNSGFSFDGWLNGWQLFMVISTLVAIGLGIGGAVEANRRPAPTPSAR